MNTNDNIVNEEFGQEDNPLGLDPQHAQRLTQMLTDAGIDLTTPCATAVSACDVLDTLSNQEVLLEAVLTGKILALFQMIGHSIINLAKAAGVEYEAMVALHNRMQELKVEFHKQIEQEKEV